MQPVREWSDWQVRTTWAGSSQAGRRIGVSVPHTLTEGAAQAIAVPGDPPVGSIRRSRERTHEQSDRRTGGQQSCQVRHGPTAGVGAAVGRHEMPGRHLPLGVHPHQKVVGLRALERDGSEVAVVIP
jgi:hypothetical protein